MIDSTGSQAGLCGEPSLQHAAFLTQGSDPPADQGKIGNPTGRGGTFRTPRVAAINRACGDAPVRNKAGARFGIVADPVPLIIPNILQRRFPDVIPNPGYVATMIAGIAKRVLTC